MFFNKCNFKHLLILIIYLRVHYSRIIEILYETALLYRHSINCYNIKDVYI